MLLDFEKSLGRDVDNVLPTFQFSAPGNTWQLRRAFLPRLSMSAEVGHCVAMTWSGYATMQVRGIMPTAKEKKMKEQLKKILSLVDVNQDWAQDLCSSRSFESLHWTLTWILQI